MSTLKYITYNGMNDEYKQKIENAMIDMMEKFKYAPIKIGTMILDELYNIIDGRWKYGLKIEKKMRERSLDIVMPKLTMEERSEEKKKLK